MARTLVPWTGNPVRMFESLRREINDLMDEFFGTQDGNELTPWFAPRINLAETDQAYEISVDLPGMKPEEFAVELKDGQLWISGERRHEHEEKGKTYHRVERQYGRFQRAVSLPTAVKADQIQAEYKDGVLRITVPKDESAQAKRIAVKT